MAEILYIYIIDIIKIIATAVIAGLILYCIQGFWNINSRLNSNTQNIEHLNRDIHNIRDRYRQLKESYLVIIGRIETLDKMWAMVWER